MTKNLSIEKLKKNEKYIYVSFGNILVSKEDTIVSLENNKVYNKKEIKYKESLSEYPEKSKKLRETLYTSPNLLDNNDIDSQVLMSTSSTSKIISGVPDYLNYFGCMPSSAAMILNYHYPTQLPTGMDLCFDLAIAMKTDPSTGGTEPGDVVPGILKVCNDNNVPISASIDGLGRAYSTFNEYINQINQNKPVIVAVYNSTATSPAYPSGFGNHAMTGVGYSTYYSQYVIVHTTGAEGNIYVNFDAGSFGNHYWVYISK